MTRSAMTQVLAYCLTRNMSASLEDPRHDCGVHIGCVAGDKLGAHEHGDVFDTNHIFETCGLAGQNTSVGLSVPDAATPGPGAVGVI